MSYLTFFKSKNKKLHCFPINITQCPKGFRIMCVNSHLLSTLVPGLGISSFVAFLEKLKGHLFLPNLLLGLGLTAGTSLMSQGDARDIALVKEGNFTAENYSCWDGKELESMDVLAIDDGVVVTAVNKYRGKMGFFESFIHALGNHIVIDHGDFYSAYAHLSHNKINVKEGDKVKKGQPIAKCGNTGNSDLPHLHFEMLYINNPLALGLFKRLTNFEPYKSTPIPWKEFFTCLHLEELTKVYEKYYYKPAKYDRTGVIDSFAFIGDKK